MRTDCLTDGAVVDLFSGCGGFSLGAREAGFTVRAAVDNDCVLASSFPHNFPNTRLMVEDARALNGDALCSAAGGNIDGIIGGPPCQGFSEIGRRDPLDPRRALVQEFFRIVLEVQPAFFIMENVRGLAYLTAHCVLEAGLGLVADQYAILGPRMWNAADFGAATNRSRLFVVGVHKDCGDSVRDEDLSKFKCAPATVRDAIRDLGGAVAVGERDGFDTWRLVDSHAPVAYAHALRAGNCEFTGHRTTMHSAEVIARFERVPEGGRDHVGRHPRLAWDGQCPVIRAGTGTDRGSHQALRPIHPKCARVITVREAARLQGFPDAHRFHPTIWHSFRMIGNSVSPIMATVILSAIRRKLGREPKKSR